MTFRVKKTRAGRSVPTPPRKRASACEHTDKPDWGRGLCKNCYDKWLKANNPEYAERQRANCREWHSKNREHVNRRSRAYWAQPGVRRRKALAQYGMSLEDYDKMLRRQDGVCAICKKPPQNGRNLHVDHCHKEGHVRGLLCFRCNYGLSFFSEEPDRLTRASRYLRRKSRR